MFAKLFEPGKIGKMTIKNRIVLPPMLMGYGSTDGYVTERMLNYFEERAKGGAGLVIVEAVGIRFEGKVFPYFVNCYDESHVAGMAELAARIKKHGARAAIQIGDGGRNTRPELTGQQPIAPSAIATYKRDQPREMTTEDVEDMVNKFVKGIELLHKAGFDGVEIHAAHVYLLNQFLSPITNIRTDKYGGSLENRARILVEILQQSKKRVGEDFPIWVRINAEEPGEEGGIDFDMCKEYALLLEKAGYDAISLSSGGNHYETTMGSMYFDAGYLLPFAEQLKQILKIPVIAVGRINAQIGEEAVASNKADFVAIGRGLMVDPELPKKAMEGRLDDITPCMSCMNCVMRGVFRDRPITCSVNAALGMEAELKLLPTEQAKNVLVIGGGPGGLEAARVAALRGHKVTLVDQNKELGGNLRLLTVAPRKGPVLGWIKYAAGQLAKLGVDVKLETKATSQLIEQINPDVAVIATGLRLGCGADVNDGIITLQDVLGGKVTVGDTVAIVGDDQMALECADLLSTMGKKVTILS